MTDTYGYTDAWVRDYACRRACGPIIVDGLLDEPAWRGAPRSPRFQDMVTPGKPGRWDTRAALLWDARCLYVGFWVEEPDVRAAYTRRDSEIYEENDVEVFIAGKDAYYELEVNARGTIMERFYIWQDAYRGAYAAAPEFALGNAPAVSVFGEPGTGHDHPRGRRWWFREWDLPGLQWAVHVDGTLNDSSDVDRGWTAEIAIPWDGLRWLADGRPLPPREGDVWRMDLSRFEWMEEDGRRVCPGWVWSPHGVYDSHIPELFTRVRFTGETALPSGPC